MSLFGKTKNWLSYTLALQKKLFQVVPVCDIENLNPYFKETYLVPRSKVQDPDTDAYTACLVPSLGPGVRESKTRLRSITEIPGASPEEALYQQVPLGLGWGRGLGNCHLRVLADGRLE